MKKLIFAAPLLLLASCNDSSRTGVDGYSFGEPTFEKNQVTIKIVTYDSIEDLRTEGRKVGATDPNLAAFAKIPVDPNDNSCTIHVMSPKVSYEPEWYGHEFMHCFYGQWHTSNADRQ